MAVSLKNARNTKIVEAVQPHPTKFHTTFVSARKLIHHGSNTCTIYYDPIKCEHEVQIDLHGYDTVTTRGKINLFLARYFPRRASLQRVAGKTILTHYAANDGTATMVSLAEVDHYNFTYA